MGVKRGSERLLHRKIRLGYDRTIALVIRCRQGEVGDQTGLGRFIDNALDAQYIVKIISGFSHSSIQLDLNHIVGNSNFIRFYWVDCWFIVELGCLQGLALHYNG